MAWSFGWGCVTKVPCHKRCERIKIPSCSKAVSAKHYRSKFYNLSYANLRSLYKWKILEKEEKKQQSINPVLYCIDVLYLFPEEDPSRLINMQLWSLNFMVGPGAVTVKILFQLSWLHITDQQSIVVHESFVFFHWQTKSKQNNYSDGNTQWNHFMECKLQYLCRTSRTDAI